MKNAWIVTRKELSEMFRDKRVRSAAVFGPVFMIVLFLALFGFILGSVGKPENIQIHVTGDSKIVTALEAAKLKVVRVPAGTDLEPMVRDGKARVVLQIPPDFDAKVAAQETARAEAIYDPKSPRSEIALRILQGVFNAQNQAAVRTILASRGVSADLAEGVRLEPKAIAAQDTGANELLISLLPYLIVIWAFYGGFGSAGELVAGEKEKGTLETLLISPVSRRDVALGKFFSLATLCLTSSLVSVLAVVLVYALRLPMTQAIFEKGLGITPAAFVAIVAVLLPTVAFFASMLLAISAIARNTREAQTYLTLASFVVLLPAVFSQVIGLTDFANARWVAFVPILNTATVIRDALLGKFDPFAIAATIGVSGLLAAAALVYVIRLFRREEILVRV